MTKKLKSVLLIDDDATTNAVNSRMILSSGLADEVTTVPSASKAISYLRKLAEKDPDKPVDLILFDLKMQEHDGYWFLEKYIQSKNIKKARLLAALTSSASFYDLERLKSYQNVAMHVYKPLTPQHLAILAKCI